MEEVKGQKEQEIQALEVGRKTVTREEEILGEIRKHWEALGTEDRTDGPAEILQETTANSVIEETFSRRISEMEVYSIVPKLRNGKSAGPDTIPNELLKNGGK